MPDSDELRLRLKNIEARIATLVDRTLRISRQRLSSIAGRKVMQSPMYYVQEKRMQLDKVAGDLASVSHRFLAEKKERFARLAQLDAISPSVLARICNSRHGWRSGCQKRGRGFDWRYARPVPGQRSIEVYRHRKISERQPAAGMDEQTPNNAAVEDTYDKAAIQDDPDSDSLLNRMTVFRRTKDLRRNRSSLSLIYNTIESSLTEGNDSRSCMETAI